MSLDIVLTQSKKRKKIMTNEEKYINFVLNYNKKLKERNANWLGPTDLGEILINTAEQNEHGCVNSILDDIKRLAETTSEK